MQDLRSHLPDVAHQGQRQSCLSFATTSAHEHARSGAEPLSVEHLFYHAVHRMPGADPSDGTGFDATSAALLIDGQPCEQAWPYLKEQPRAPDWVPPAHGLPCYSSEFARTSLDVSDITRRLDSHQTVVLGLVITDRFFFAGANGYLPDRSPDPERTGHAVLAVGHGVEGNERRVLVRNSWGPGWGMSGHAWLPESYLYEQLVECGIVRHGEMKT